MTVKETNRLFPVFLKLEQLSLLVVGGGNVGLEKLTAVLNNSPATQIKLVATQISDAIHQLAKQHRNLELIQRPFKESDLDDADVVIVAVNDKAVSASIRAAAKQAGKLVNVADTPDQCDFYLGSIVTKGQLKIAISTNGKSPTIAKRLKENFSEMLPAELDDVLDNMEQIRNSLKGDFANKVTELNKITSTFAANNTTSRKKFKISMSHAILLGLMCLLIGILAGYSLS